MIAVLTQDPKVALWCCCERSNVASWGRLEIVSACGESAAAAQLRRALQGVRRDEPVCVVGQGDDDGIGGIGRPAGDWRLPFDRVGWLLAAGLPSGFIAPIMIRNVGAGRSEFTRRIASWLGYSGLLRGVCLYTDASTVTADESLPEPAALGRNALLAASRVRRTGFSSCLR